MGVITQLVTGPHMVWTYNYIYIYVIYVWCARIKLRMWVWFQTNKTCGNWSWESNLISYWMDICKEVSSIFIWAHPRNHHLVLVLGFFILGPHFMTHPFYFRYHIYIYIHHISIYKWYIYIYTPVCTYIDRHIHVYICIFIYTYTFIHIYP